jgi:hypothetical protein
VGPTQSRGHLFIEEGFHTPGRRYVQRYQGSSAVIPTRGNTDVLYSYSPRKREVLCAGKLSFFGWTDVSHRQIIVGLFISDFPTIAVIIRRD